MDNCSGLDKLFIWIAWLFIILFIADGIAAEYHYRYDDHSFTKMYCHFHDRVFEFEPKDIVQQDSVFFKFEEEGKIYYIPIKACYQVKENE